jgi:hypothetical protein
MRFLFGAAHDRMHGFGILRAGCFAVSGVNLVLYCTFERTFWLPCEHGSPSDNALLSDLGSRHDFISTTPTINNKNQEKITGMSLFVAVFRLRRVSMPQYKYGSCPLYVMVRTVYPSAWHVVWTIVSIK